MTRARSIRTETASGPECRRRRLAALLACALSCASVPAGCKSDDDMTDDGGIDDTIRCERDESEGYDTALPLEDGSATGAICPLEDEDWYALSVTDDAPIVKVDLRMDNPRALVEVTYAIWSTKKDGSPDEAVALPDTEAIGGPLTSTHLLPAGDYFLVVRDQGDDREDLRNHYQLAVTALPEPDDHEPNDDLDSATDAASGDTQTGYLASTGDEDWYAVDVPPGSVVRITLTMPNSDVSVTVTLVDPAGVPIVSDAHLADDGSDADLRIVRVLAAGGIYYVVVSDDDGMNADTDTPYTLHIEVLQDLDDNEPNDHPDEATSLSDQPVQCGADWTPWLEAVGTIGSPGDNDWYAVTLPGCVGGVLEAELRLGEALDDAAAWALQREVQASVTLVREHVGSACAPGDDEQCRELAIPCNVDDELLVSWDCAGFFNSCAGTGFCTGATVCLPTGRCGANQTQRYYEPQPPPSPITGPPGNQAFLSAPIQRSGTYYLRVSDFQADGGDPEALYELRVRVRQDPDVLDRSATGNNLYSNRLTEDDLPVAQSADLRVTMPVEDATVSPQCADGPWNTGAISYENDLDFWRFDHPCPAPAVGALPGDGDCMLGIAYEIDAGAVNPAIFVYADAGTVAASFPVAAGTSGYYGRVGANDDACFFAYHTRPEYTVMVRDQAEDGRDWDSDQNYRFCIERWSDTCQAPCEEYGDPAGDCGRPTP